MGANLSQGALHAARLNIQQSNIQPPSKNNFARQSSVAVDVRRLILFQDLIRASFYLHKAPTRQTRRLLPPSLAARSSSPADVFPHPCPSVVKDSLVTYSAPRSLPPPILGTVSPFPTAGEPF